MVENISYSKREQTVLWLIAVLGFFGINGVFIYALVAQPDAMQVAFANPIAAAFMVETFILLGLLSYLFTKWRVARLSWGWFLVLSLLGSMAFAIPVVLLFPRR